MAKVILSKEQRENFLSYIRYKAAIFPRGKFIQKLRDADSAYHLAALAVTAEQEEIVRKSAQLNSRFPDLQVALVREIAETYGVKYITTFLGKQAIFQMTSSGEDTNNATESQAFNTIFQDQQRELKWRANLTKALLDVAKYNFCVVDTDWVFRNSYNLTADTNRGESGQNVKRSTVKWSGNQIAWVDPYNFIFDHEVDVEDLATKGEWAAHIETYSQSALKILIDQLNADPDMTVYTTDSDNPNFHVFSVQAGQDGVYNLEYRAPDVVTSGSEESEVEKINWVKHTTGYSVKTSNAYQPTRGYTVAKCVVRAVPGSFGIGAKDILSDEVAFYTIYVLEGSWVLAAKKHTNLHEMLPFIVGQTDSDALRYNTSGPAQISLSYQKTAKALQDRVLAAADRAIGDRALYDSNYISDESMKSKVPDPKISLRKSLLGNKTFQQIYYQIPFNGGEVFRLADYARTVQEAGRKAAGINPAQAGQFVPGNKTLEEYNDTMINANDKLYVRSLALESGFFSDIKRILKLNVIQYQQEAKLYSEEAKTEITIQPTQLYKARVDFQIADALMPSKFMLSPNVQQQLLQYLGIAPDVFREYDVPRLIGQILTQSVGIPLHEFKLKNPPTQPPAKSQE